MTTPAPIERNATLKALDAAAAGHLSAMAIGAITAGQMPPRPVMEWLVANSVEELIAIEKHVINNPDTNSDPAIGSLLERRVMTVALMQQVCTANKLLVLEEQMRSGLRARLLYLPPHFDSTYEGTLRG